VPQLELDVLDSENGSRFWTGANAAAAGFATTIRLGCLPSELGQALDLLHAQLLVDDGSLATVSVLPGVIRWSCNSSGGRIQNLREIAAGRDWPLTLERAQWDVLSVVGHYGAYRDAVGNLVASLRGVFDGRGILVAPLGETA